MALTADQESKKLFKHYLGTSDSKEKREFFEEPINSSFTVSPRQLWTYGDKIPLGDEAISLGIPLLDNNGIYSWQKSDAETFPIVKRYKDYSFSAIDTGTDNAFVLLDLHGNNIQHIIPFNFSDDIYNYTLKTRTGKLIPFGVGDWVFDTYSGVLTFYGKVPVGVDHLNPPSFSFFQYVGDTGFRQDRLGLDGTVLPLNEVEIPAGVSVISNSILTNKIIETANKIAPDFVTTYGWDGSDTSEGIALSFESQVTLVYTATKDEVKGYDDSINAEIGTVLSRVHPVIEASSYSTIPFDISFVNENANISINGTKVNYKLTFNGLNVKLSKNGVEGAVVVFDQKSIMIRDADEKVYVILTKNDSTTVDYSGTCDFTLTRSGDVSLALVYWSSSKKQVWPFVTKELGIYNTGFPVAVANGKVPPSLEIGSIPLSGFGDIITPDYYGPRVHNIVIAQDNEFKTKSADYIVKNSSGYFLNDVLSAIVSDNPSLTGTIYLRNGTYRVNSNTLDLSQFRNIEFLGEDKTKVIITGPTDDSLLSVRFIDDVSLDPCNFGLRNFTFKNSNILLSSESGKTFVLNNILGINSNISIVKRAIAPTVLIKNTNINTLSISSPEVITDETRNSINFDSITTFIYDNTINVLTANVLNTSIRGNYIKSASLDNGSIFFKENEVDTLLTKVTGAIINGCSIKTYGASIAKNEYPSNYATGSIPIFGRDGYNYQKYVNLAAPFYYEEFAQDGSSVDLIKISLDSEVLEINQEGQLTTCLTSDRINVGTLKFDTYALNDNLDEATRRKFEGGTLTQALNLLSEFKADLISGKVPLRQLPDAVAYGGLLYKGTWCFDEHSGIYPTKTDLVTQGSDYDVTKENYIEDLQPGWFVIINPSAISLSENNPVRDQTASDGTIFTAGDWCVWNGSAWEKLDRAYQDACYAILAANDPDNNPWYWKKNGSTGWLDFSNVTIYEAFHRINDLFTKLIPKRPASINDSSISLDIKTSLTNYLIKKIYNDGSLSTTKNAFNINEPNAKRIVIGTPDFSSRKDIIYYGDTSNISAIIDGSIVGSLSLNSANNNVGSNGALFIKKDIDPYDKEDFGSGFWKGISVDIAPQTDITALGQHTYSLALDNALPETVTSFVNGSKSKSYELFLPYSPNSLVLGETTVTDFDPTLPNAKTYSSACSGIYKLPFSFTVNLSTIIQKAWYDNIKDSTGLFEIKNSIENTYEMLEGYSLDKSNDSDDTDRFFDLVITNYSKNFNVNRVYESFKFTSKVNGTLENSSVETDIHTFRTRIDNVSESERVTSGMSNYIYPIYNNNSSNGLNQCGKSFVSTNLLTSGYYVSELMKIGRNRFNTDGSFKDVAYEYKWPQGIYYYLTNSSIDYSNVAGSLLDQSYLPVDDTRDWLKTEEFRWVTFEKFIGESDYSEVILKEANGFVINFDVSDDKLDKFIMDDLSGSTKGMAIYAKVLGIDTISQTYLSDSEMLNTGWIDCNSPYNGFSRPKNNGDAAMYAGSSTATQKRITFGREVKSGKLIIRVGITKSSGIEFKGISIKEIV